MRIGSKITVRIALRRGFYLDHASPEIGQQGRGVRTGNKGCTLKDGNVLQGLDRHETFLSDVGEFKAHSVGLVARAFVHLVLQGSLHLIESVSSLLSSKMIFKRAGLQLIFSKLAESVSSPRTVVVERVDLIHGFHDPQVQYKQITPEELDESSSFLSKSRMLSDRNPVAELHFVLAGSPNASRNANYPEI